jgi:hypothetical protein
MHNETPFADELRARVANESIRDDLAGDAAQRVAGALVMAAAEAAAVEGIQLDDDIPADKQFFSIGHACQLAQVTPTALRAVMKALGIRFAYSQNDIGYLDGNAVLAVCRRVRAIRKGQAQ